VEYLNHTSLKTYFPYMMGGGYVLSADLAAVILGINQQSRGHDLLKFMPNEDVSVGFWLMSVDMRRIDHQRVVGAVSLSGLPVLWIAAVLCSRNTSNAIPVGAWWSTGSRWFTRSCAPVTPLSASTCEVGTVARFTAIA